MTAGRKVETREGLIAERRALRRQVREMTCERDRLQGQIASLLLVATEWSRQITEQREANALLESDLDAAKIKIQNARATVGAGAGETLENAISRRLLSTGEITVDPTHPLWAAWDDDDWHGATAGNWMRTNVVPGARVELEPPDVAPESLVGRIAAAMWREGALVTLAPRRRDGKKKGA